MYPEGRRFKSSPRHLRKRRSGPLLGSGPSAAPGLSCAEVPRTELLILIAAASSIGHDGDLDSSALDDFRPSDLDAREIGILTPALEVADVVEQAFGVGEIANRPGVDRLLLAVVEAGCATLEIACAPRTDAQEH